MVWTWKRHGWRLGALCAAAILLSGCATNKTDWEARVGTYTYDQALLDFGPPDKSAQLKDGVTVAEWLTRRGYVRRFYTGGYGCYPYWGPAYSSSVGYRSPDRYLRLVFDEEGTLQAWKRVSR